MPDAEQVVYRPKEALPLVPVSKTTFYRWLNDGTIPSFRIHRSIFIRASAIEHLLNPAGETTASKAA